MERHDTCVAKARSDADAAAQADSAAANIQVLQQTAATSAAAVLQCAMAMDSVLIPLAGCIATWWVNTIVPDELRCTSESPSSISEISVRQQLVNDNPGGVAQIIKSRFPRVIMWMCTQHGN